MAQNEYDDDRYRIYRWVNVRQVIIFDSYSIVTRALGSLLIFNILDLIGLQSEYIDFGIFFLFTFMLVLEERTLGEPLLFQIIRGSILYSMRQGLRSILTSNFRAYYKKDPTINQYIQDFPPLHWILFEIDFLLHQIGLMIKIKAEIILAHHGFEYFNKFIHWVLREVCL